MSIEVVSYSDEWPRQYEVIRSELLRAVGGQVVAIEHIGSTSIPNMPAKQIIDVQVGVEDFAVAAKISDCFPTLALMTDIQRDHIPFHDHEEFRPSYEKRFLRGKVRGIVCNVHVRIMDRPNWKFALLFRDYLRGHPQAATAYMQVKQRMAESGLDSNAYCWVKDPVCDLIFLLALEWVKNKGETSQASVIVETVEET